MNPITFNLSLQRWQLFVTLTFRSKDESGNVMKVPNEAARQSMLFAFLRSAAKGQKRDGASGKRIDCFPWSSFFWVAREERGELNGRHHFHILLDGLPPGRLNTVERFALKALWDSVGGGFSDVRSFDTRLPGVRYVLKGLEGWSQKNANAYEAKKFTDDHEGRRLILAESCVSKWARVRSNPRASGGAYPSNEALRSVGLRERAIKQAKETVARHLGQGLFVLNQHPAGVSFVS